jgi:hypothetical protein
MYKIMCLKNQNPYSNFCWDSSPSVPNENQIRMMKALRGALSEGLSYNTDVNAYVANRLSDILDENVLEEGHPFSYDVYTARKVVELNMTHEANVSACKKLLHDGSLAIGLKIKGLYFGSKTYSTAIVVGVDVKTGMVNFEGKRRGVRGTWAFSMGANRTHLLKLIIKNINDRDTVVTHNGGISTYTIDIGQNRNTEYKCQVM